ncbi:unnamed protein product, partial [Prorocentrum cordatum]
GPPTSPSRDAPPTRSTGPASRRSEEWHGCGESPKDSSRNARPSRASRMGSKGSVEEKASILSLGSLDDDADARRKCAADIGSSSDSSSESEDGGVNRLGIDGSLEASRHEGKARLLKEQARRLEEMARKLEDFNQRRRPEAMWRESSEKSTPWAVQLREDMNRLAEVDESMHAWSTSRKSDLDIFIPGGKGKGNKEDDLVQAVMALQKLCLRTAAEGRDLTNIVGEFWLVPSDRDVIKTAKETGADCASRVKTIGKGHGLGPPYLHVASEVLGATRDSLDPSVPEEQEAKIIVDAWTTMADNADYGRAFVSETIRMFRVSDAHRKDDEMEGPDHQGKLMFALSPHFDLMTALKMEKKTIAPPAKEFHAEKLLQAMGVALRKAGGAKPIGSGPKPELDRVVERQLKALQKK